MIPTRNQIIEKINEIRDDPTFTGARDDLVNLLSEWLDDLKMPETIIIAEHPVSPKEQIMGDIESYF